MAAVKTILAVVALACVSSAVPLQQLRGHDKRRVLSNVKFPETKVVAQDGERFDRFGVSVSLSGNILAVGASGDAENGPASGSVVIFENVDGDWIEDATVVPDDGAAFDFFATSMAIDGDVLVAGAFLDDDNRLASSGSAYVYEKKGSEYVLATKITASDAVVGDQFGRPVAVKGDTIVVGAGLNDEKGVSAGAVYVFNRVNSQWVETTKLTASDASDGALFGTALDLIDDTLVVGAFGAGNDQGVSTGAAYVFQLGSSGWSETQKIVGNTAEGGDFFGGAVSIAGTTIVVGSSGASESGPTSGAVYVFESSDGNEYTEVAKLLASDGFSGDGFGGVVDNVGETIVVGAASSDEGGTNVGAAYMFGKDGSEWVEKAKLIAQDGSPNDFFGSSAVATDELVVIGSLFAENDGADTGAVYITQTDAFGGQIRTCLPRVVSFTGFDPTDATDFSEFLSSIVDLSDYHDGELNIEAAIDDCGDEKNIQCVRLELGSHTQIERRKPYTLFSYRGTPDIGPHVLKACVYPHEECRGEPTSCKELETTVVECEVGVTRLVAYDATNDIPIGTIDDGSEICLPSDGQVNIEAVAPGCVGAVLLKLEGEGRKDERYEGTAPYFLYGDQNGDVFGRGGFQPNVDYAISASSFGVDGASGPSLQKIFRFKEC